MDKPCCNNAPPFFVNNLHKEEHNKTHIEKPPTTTDTNRYYRPDVRVPVMVQETGCCRSLEESVDNECDDCRLSLRK